MRSIALLASAALLLSVVPSGSLSAQERGSPDSIAPGSAKPNVPPYFQPDDSGYVAGNTYLEGVTYYRRLFAIVFDSSANGSAVAAFLATFGGQIVGGWPSGDAYIIQVADPGPTLKEVTALRRRMDAAYGVKYALLVPRSTGPQHRDGELAATAEESRSAPPCGQWPKLDNYPTLDPSRVVTDPGTGVVFHRTDLLLRFQTGTSEAAKCALFRAYNATVIGETFTGGFFVRIPDPHTWERFDALVTRLKADPTVYLVLRLDIASPVLITNAARRPTAAQPAMPKQ